MLLEEDELRRAVEMHRRSYRLLLWCGRMAGRGVVDAARLHHDMNDAEAAADWVRRMRLSFPADARPAEDDCEPFARFFCTYLKTSFVLHRDPRLERVSACGCWCPWCTLVRQASRLQPRGFGRRDRKRADRLIADVLNTLALRSGAKLFGADFDPLMQDVSFAQDAAVVTYAQWLIRRTRGFSDGPSVLALWRRISWSEGRRDRDFELTTDSALAAERRVVTRMCAVGSG